MRTFQKTYCKECRFFLPVRCFPEMGICHFRHPTAPHLRWRIPTRGNDYCLQGAPRGGETQNRRSK